MADAVASPRRPPRLPASAAAVCSERIRAQIAQPGRVEIGTRLGRDCRRCAGEIAALAVRPCGPRLRAGRRSGRGRLSSLPARSWTCRRDITDDAVRQGERVDGVRSRSARRRWPATTFPCADRDDIPCVRPDNVHVRKQRQETRRPRSPVYGALREPRLRGFAKPRLRGFAACARSRVGPAVYGGLSGVWGDRVEPRLRGFSVCRLEPSKPLVVRMVRKSRLKPNCEKPRKRGSKDRSCLDHPPSMAGLGRLRRKAP